MELGHSAHSVLRPVSTCHTGSGSHGNSSHQTNIITVHSCSIGPFRSLFSPPCFVKHTNLRLSLVMQQQGQSPSATIHPHLWLVMQLKPLMVQLHNYMLGIHPATLSALGHCCDYTEYWTRSILRCDKRLHLFYVAILMNCLHVFFINLKTDSSPPFPFWRFQSCYFFFPYTHFSFWRLSHHTFSNFICFCYWLTCLLFCVCYGHKDHEFFYFFLFFFFSSLFSTSSAISQ